MNETMIQPELFKYFQVKSQFMIEVYEKANQPRNPNQPTVSQYYTVLQSLY